MGLTSGIGRLGASVMPLITMNIFNISTLGPFLGFSIAAGAMTLATFFIPYEPLGRQLDNITKNPEEELREYDKAIELEKY